MEEILGGEVRSWVTRGGVKAGDENGHKGYSRKAFQVKDHTLEGHIIRLGPNWEYVHHASA